MNVDSKLTLRAYLKRRGPVNSLTKIEADIFGVPYPLVKGWAYRHGTTEITAAMLEDLKARIALAHPTTTEKAQRGLDGARVALDAMANVSQSGADHFTDGSKMVGALAQPRGAADRYEAYTKACKAQGVLPCSYESFAADQAHANPVAEAGIPASIATGALAQAQGHLMDLVAMIVDRDTPPDLDGDHVVDWDITGKPITRRMVNGWAKAGREGGAEASAGSAGARMDSGCEAGAGVGANPAVCMPAEAEQAGHIGAEKNEGRSGETRMDAASAALNLVATADMLKISRGALMRLARQVMAEDVGEEDEMFLSGRAHGIGSLHAEILRRDAEHLAKEMLAKPADEVTHKATDAELANILNTTLWLYRRLPHAYGNPPFVDRAILNMAERLGLDDVPAAIKERATLVANSRTGSAP